MDQSFSTRQAPGNVLEKVTKVDFKIVSFTLAGKEYGIDIMKVKEIRKAGNFTKVPNTPSFVRGVENLRGDIIPIIDLRIMFHLPAEQISPDLLENIIILKLDALVVGVIVDSIEKVIGISKESIQAPHPLFGDINIQYILGVVDFNKILYVLLDVEKIFARSTPNASSQHSAPVGAQKLKNDQLDSRLGPSQNLELQFITETLAAFSEFFVTGVNRAWVVSKIESWKTDRQLRSQNFQLATREDSDEFLSTFLSARSFSLWSMSDLASLSELVKTGEAPITVWNIGCGKGYESYSLASFFEIFNPGSNYKIWGNDSDLLNISLAPSLVFSEEELPPEFRKLCVQMKSGLQLEPRIKDRIFFEFHDVRNINPFKDLFLIVARDVLSFLAPKDQERILTEFWDKLKPGGYLILGDNEVVLDDHDWHRLENKSWIVFQKSN